jgi:uncharacterized protein
MADERTAGARAATTGPARPARPGARRYGAALLVVLVPYGVAAGYLKLQETELVFHALASRAVVATALPAGLDDVTIPGEGGTTLAAVRLRLPDAATGTWILHLHGNADSAFSRGQMEHVRRLGALGYSVLAPDTRGLGRTPGTPSEAGYVADAEAALRWLLAAGVPASRIIVWGHSLGSGPAVELAARHPGLAGLVTFGAFTSVPDRGAELYPWLPVKLIASIRFDNLARIGAVRIPVVIAHATTDATIPYAHARRLYAAANEPKQLLTLAAVTDDGFGGHVTALYDQLERLRPLLPAPAAQEQAGAAPPQPR